MEIFEDFTTMRRARMATVRDMSTREDDTDDEERTPLPRRYTPYPRSPRREDERDDDPDSGS